MINELAFILALTLTCFDAVAFITRCSHEHTWVYPRMLLDVVAMLDLTALSMYFVPKERNTMIGRTVALHFLNYLGTFAEGKR